MNLSIGNRIILLIGTLTSFFFFVAPFNLYGLSYLVMQCRIQGQIVTVTLLVLLVKSLLETYDKHKFGPRQY